MAVCGVQWFENERQRLINLRDRASEQGRKKEYPTCCDILHGMCVDEARWSVWWGGAGMGWVFWEGCGLYGVIGARCMGAGMLSVEGCGDVEERA